MDTLLAQVQRGDTDAAEAGMQMVGDLYMYWHIRGKNLTAREYGTSFLASDRAGSHTTARSGALLTVGLAARVLGQYERANGLWSESFTIAEERPDERERCVAALFVGLGLIGFDLGAGLLRTAESIGLSEAVGFAWRRCWP